MIGRDVGEHRRLVRLVAHALEHEAAARGLEDGDVDVAPVQDHGRAAGTRPVAGVDDPLVDEDPVGRRRADVVAGAEQDVGDEPGDRGLAVGPGDRHDGHPPVRVTDPRGRRRAGAPDPLRPAVDDPLLGPGEPDASAGVDGPRRQVERRVGDDPRPLGAGPRPGDDPAAGVRCPVDLARAAALTVVRAEAPGPRDEVRHGVRPVSRRHRSAEVDERPVRRRPRPLPRASPPDGDLDLDHRQQPVDVGSLVEADLDQAHGPPRIREASGTRRSFPAAPTGPRTGRRQPA